MERRTFLKISSLSVIAVSLPGFIRFNGERFIGDCETTTDILGPFYRPDAPIRNNLLVPGDGGNLINLTGTIYHDDCATPLAKAMVDLWHCGPDGIYDNTTDEFRYRGKCVANQNGSYQFRTIIPVPYDLGGGIRPAHFHLLISAPGYQDLVTQLYFTGDPYLTKDPYSASPQAKKRILDLRNNSAGEKEIRFDIIMKEHFPAEDAVLEKLSGKYINIKNPDETGIFYKNEHQLWLKFYSTQYKMDLNYDLLYVGNNKFNRYGTNEYYQFTILKDGIIKLTIIAQDENGKDQVVLEALKEK